MSKFWNSDAPLTGDQYAHLMFYLMITAAVTGIIWGILRTYKETLIYPDHLIRTFILAYVMGWITMIFGLISLFSLVVGTGMFFELLSGDVKW